MGRPTTYDPAYCDEVIEFLRDGYSLQAFAGHIEVSRATIYNWMDEHPEFMDAVKRAQPVAALAWEKRLRTLSTTGEGNATAIIFGLKNRAVDDWRDVTRNEHSGPDGKPIKTEAVSSELEAFDNRLLQATTPLATPTDTGGDEPSSKDGAQV